MKLTRKSTEFCQFFCRQNPPDPTSEMLHTHHHAWSQVSEVSKKDFDQLSISAYSCHGTRSTATTSTTVHSEKDERWLWRASSRVWRFCGTGTLCPPRDSKLEKASKKGTSTGVRTANVLLCKWSERPGFLCTVMQVEWTAWIFMVFTQFSVLGGKPGRNPILLMACFLEK